MVIYYGQEPDPDPTKKVRIRPDPDPQHCCTVCDAEACRSARAFGACTFPFVIKNKI
jgi:hypothetical protein